MSGPNPLAPLLHRRVVGLVAGLLTAWWGVECSPDTVEKAWMAVFGLGSAGAYCWSLLQKIDRVELGRRLWPAVGAGVIAMAGALGLDIPEEAFRHVSVQVTSSVTVLSGIWSMVQANRVAAVPSVNP